MIWVGALVLFGYWILFNMLTAVLLSWTPAPGATIPSFSQEFLDTRRANVEGTPSDKEIPVPESMSTMATETADGNCIVAGKGSDVAPQSLEDKRKSVEGKVSLLRA
jgi:hypothetical protein